jgi:hypothetical protein
VIAPRACLTERARQWAFEQVGDHDAALSRVAAGLGVAWWAVMNQVIDRGIPLVEDPARLDPAPCQNSMQDLSPGVSLAELGCSSVLVDHFCEESMMPRRAGSPWGGGCCRGLSASRVEVRTTTVGIPPGAGARGDRAGVTLVCLSEPGAGAKQKQRLFRDLPELLSTAADGPVMGREFSISAGQQSV